MDPGIMELIVEMQRMNDEYLEFKRATDVPVVPNAQMNSSNL